MKGSLKMPAEVGNYQRNSDTGNTEGTLSRRVINSGEAKRCGAQMLNVLAFEKQN